MSALGQLLPSQFGPVANNVRYASDSDHSRHWSDLTRRAKSDRRTAANSIAIRSPRWRGRAALQNFHAERLRGLEVDDEIV
jgi:hypothetical protein